MSEMRYTHYVYEDETWFTFDPKNTATSAKVWIPRNAPRPQIPSSRLTPRKCLVLIAMTADLHVSVETLPYGESINGEVYKKFVWNTGEKWRKLRHNPLRLKDVVWQHDNARPHVAHNVQEFFQTRGVQIQHQSPYSPDLNLCDRFINDYIKQELRDQSFSNHDEVRVAVDSCLRSLSTAKLRHEVDKLMVHCERIVACGGGWVTPNS